MPDIASASVLTALAEPNRRRIVELLAMQGQMTATGIAREFDVTSAAISQHLKVLREAGVVSMSKQAQRRLYVMNPEALSELEDWVKRMKAIWAARLDQLDVLLQDQPKDQPNDQKTNDKEDK